jgi:hypothetical protein
MKVHHRAKNIQLVLLFQTKLFLHSGYLLCRIAGRYLTIKPKIAYKITMPVIDTFIKLREILIIHKDLAHQLEKVQSKLEENDNQLLIVFECIKLFGQTKLQESEQKNRPRIVSKSSKE